MAEKKEQGSMSFWEHLEELRWHILRSIIAIMLFMVVAFFARNILFDVILLGPSTPDFITYQWLCKLGQLINTPGLCMSEPTLKIINITLSGQFMVHMYISIMFGIVMAFPYVLWEIWRFVKPALLPVEKANSRGAVFAATMLFYVGVVFAYILIVPLTINFLSTYTVSAAVENTIGLRSYINTVVSLSFAVGLVFELPIVVFFLTKIGVLSPDLMKRGRRVALVIVLAVAAIITPADIFSMVMVAIPLYILYEASILISKRVYRKREKEEQLVKF